MADLIQELQVVFGQWLMEDHCDVLHTKEQLIEAQENGAYVDEFAEWVKQNV